MRRRKASATTEVQRQRVEERRGRRERARAARHAAAARETAIRAALSRRPVGTAEQALERVLTGSRGHAPRFCELVEVVVTRAPRLVADDTLGAFKLMADLEWVQPVSTWRPAGHGRDTLFRSLSQHLFARFPMPAVLWTAFLAEDGAPVLAPVAAHVAAGGSLYELVRSGAMPVPLTRRMCHDVLTQRGESSFLGAIRGAQVLAAGGTSGLNQAWKQTRIGRRLHDRSDEGFWQGVLTWLCRNPALPYAEIGPFLDYIGHRRGEGAGFSMKGRSVAALQRGMRQWHAELARERAVHGVRFEPSGLQPMTLDRSRRDRSGRRVTEIWHVREILDTKTLLDEGRVMGHCVYSYARLIDKRECAIWTLTLEDDTGHWRRLTIEARPALRLVVQARGRFNKLPEARDMIALNAWAGRNSLTLGVSAS
jgi:hypothetical protein